jgi:tetratricopeptide (TPR) repeat protein
MYIAIAMAAAASLASLTGCREGVELNELERVLAEYRQLPEAEQEPALRELAASGTPEAKFAWYELGNIYYARAAADKVEPGEESPTGTNALLDSALVFFGAATEADSAFVEPLVNAGLIWDDLSEGRTPEAMAAMNKATDLYLRAIAARPGDEKACCNLGSLYFRRHMYMEALVQFKAALEANPRSALAHYNLAIMFAESRMYREAIVEWKDAAEFDEGGDIRERSLENIKVIRDLMEAEVPANLAQPSAEKTS